MLFRGACTRVGVMKIAQVTIPLANIASGKGEEGWVSECKTKEN